MASCPACEASAHVVSARACFLLGFHLGTMGLDTAAIAAAVRGSDDDARNVVFGEFCEECRGFLDSHSVEVMNRATALMVAISNQKND